MIDDGQAGEQSLYAYIQIPSDGTDVWEIDFSLLKFGKKVASGSYGDLYVSYGLFYIFLIKFKLVYSSCFSLFFSLILYVFCFFFSYRGSYYSQDVAIKVLKPERLKENMMHEFAQEVYIMRSVQNHTLISY